MQLKVKNYNLNWSISFCLSYLILSFLKKSFISSLFAIIPVCDNIIDILVATLCITLCYLKWVLITLVGDVDYLYQQVSITHINTVHTVLDLLALLVTW